ncbi:MAG: 3'-5' exonuclease [Clostridia bacterium]|nr:3'-5' exonuclease [Clostridia bacterium]
MDFVFLLLIISIIIYIVHKSKKDSKTEQQKQEKEYQEKRKQRIEEIKLSFNNTLNAMDIKTVNIKNNTDYIKKILKEIPEYKFSQITKKTSKQIFKDFIVLDVETTGLSSKNDDIIEISAIKFKNYAPTEYMTTLVKPKKEISEEVTKINNITNEMLQNCPNISEVIDSFSEFIKGFNIVGYNLEFDLKFLYVNNLDLFSEKRKFYDVLELARKVINPDYIKNYKLTTVCEYANLYRDNAHRALSDALATGILFRDFCIEKTENYELRETNTFINE